jgi:hypothetical protein
MWVAGEVLVCRQVGKCLRNTYRGWPIIIQTAQKKFYSNTLSQDLPEESEDNHDKTLQDSHYNSWYLTKYILNTNLE